MARRLIIQNDIIVNIVESPTAPDPTVPGEIALVAVTGTETPGDNMLLVLWYVKALKMAALDAKWATVSDYNSTVKAGNLATFTDAQYTGLMAGNARNYRSKRNACMAAATITACNAVDVTTGWSTNP